MQPSPPYVRKKGFLISISSRIGAVASVATETNTEARLTAEAAEKLVRIAVGLRRVVEQFTLPKHI
ncbi:MAG: hypothetical protein WCO60_10445 [Verrucomicrobiota bacterium]